MSVTVSLINRKGGVGKTTLSAQLAHTADRRGLRTLVVDLDPQSHLSRSILSSEKYIKLLKDKKPTISALFEGYLPPMDGSGSSKPVNINDVIIKKAGYWEGTTLEFIPSRLDLFHTLKNPTGKERRLAKALSKVSEQYDLILLDCPPTESILTEAAYHASRYVLVPVKPEFLSTIGLPLLARSINEFKYDNTDHDLDICGIVFNHSSSRCEGPQVKKSVKDVQMEVKKNGWHIYNTHVRYSTSYPKSVRERTPIENTSHVRWEVAEEFSKFVDELFASVGLDKATS